MSTAKLLAKLGPKVARIPMGEKRAARIAAKTGARVESRMVTKGRK